MGRRPAEQPLTRRRVLGVGIAAAAAFSINGNPQLRAGVPWARRRGGVARLRLPQLASTGTVATGAVQRFRSRPDLAPSAVVLDIAKPGLDSGLIFMDSHGGPGAQGPMIIDSAGQLVWFNPISTPRSSTRAFNLRVQYWRGKPVLTWFDGAVVDEHGAGTDVVMDASYKEIARVRAGNGYVDDLHAFYLTPQGTALITSYGVASADLSAYGGKANGEYVYGVCQEIDLSSGKVVFEWRSDQHVGLGESYAPISRYGSNPWDYFHINSICLARDGNLIISGRNTWGAYKVERPSGAVLWRLGGKKSDFTLGPGAHFAWQHDVTEHADGSFTVFDNGAGDYRSEPQSRGLLLKVDEHTHHATLTHAYLHPRAPLQAGALGSVELLPGGHAFVGWGLEAAFTEYGADRTALLDGHLAGPGAQSYRAFRCLWAGTPADPPTAAVVGHGGTMTVYASWNGATTVQDWVVLGGDHHGALSALGTAKRQGFETVIQVPRRAAFVAVAQERSFTRAAARLGVSQSALSQTIAGSRRGSGFAC